MHIMEQFHAIPHLSRRWANSRTVLSQYCAGVEIGARLAVFRGHDYLPAALPHLPAIGSHLAAQVAVTSSSR